MTCGEGDTVHQFEVERATIGWQNELELTHYLFSAKYDPYASEHGFAAAFRLNAHFGTKNKDRSRGLNAGAKAELVSVELSSNNATFGINVGLGAEASIGVRKGRRGNQRAFAPGSALTLASCSVSVSTLTERC